MSVQKIFCLFQIKFVVISGDHMIFVFRKKYFKPGRRTIYPFIGLKLELKKINKQIYVCNDFCF